MSLFSSRLAIWLALVCVALNMPCTLALPRMGGTVSLKLGGAPSQMGDGAYPRATYLSDGSLLGIYTAFEGGNNILKIVKSTDDASTWSDVGSVTNETSATHDLDNGAIMQLPSGRIIVSYRNHDKDPSTGAFTFYRITVCGSDDGGKTFNFLSQAHEESDPGKSQTTRNEGARSNGPPVKGVWEPFLRTAANGDLQIYYSLENSKADQDVQMRTSTDAGATWGPQVTVIGADATNRRDGMPGVATVGPKALVAVFESSLDGVFSVQAVTSADDGATWGPRQTVYAPPGGMSAQSPQIVNAGGTLVASFMTNEDTGSKDESVKVVTSADGGRSWGGKTLIADAPQFWPGLTAAPSRTGAGAGAGGPTKGFIQGSQGSESFLCLYGNGKQLVQKVMVRRPY